MSNHNHGCCGHVVKTKELTKLIPEKILPEWNKALEENDCDKAQEILDQHLLNKYPRPEQCFILNDECESEEVELEVMYTYWDREELFIQVKSPEMIALTEQDIKPEFCHWVTFG